jgi:hypothetical protein
MDVGVMDKQVNGKKKGRKNIFFALNKKLFGHILKAKKAK